MPLADDVVTLASGGADSLSFTVAADADWLSVTPADGAAGPAGTPLHIRYDARRLPIGEYSAVITVASPQAYNSPRTLTVHLSVMLPSVDYDHDGDVDIADFSIFQYCFNGASRPPRYAGAAGRLRRRQRRRTLIFAVSPLFSTARPGPPRAADERRLIPFPRLAFTRRVPIIPPL